MKLDRSDWKKISSFQVPAWVGEVIEEVRRRLVEERHFPEKMPMSAVVAEMARITLIAYPLHAKPKRSLRVVGKPKPKPAK